jgi:hypothetical protein
MIRRIRNQEQLVALFVLGALLLLPPLLAIFNRPRRVLGVPVLYLYLFLAWAALIGLTAAVARRAGAAQSRGGSNSASPDPAAAERQPDA